MAQISKTFLILLEIFGIAMLLVALTGLTWLIVFSYLRVPKPGTYEICRPAYRCLNQTTDCPELKIVDLRQLPTWNNDSTITLIRACIYGKCSYKLEIIWTNASTDTLKLGENWLHFFNGTTTNGTTVFLDNSIWNIYYYNSIITDSPFSRETWSEVYSSFCLSFLTKSSRRNLAAYLDYMEYATGDMEIYCSYTYDCYAPLVFPASETVKFPVKAK